MSQDSQQLRVTAICVANISKYSFNHDDILSPKGLVFDPLKNDQWSHIEKNRMVIRLYSNSQQKGCFQIAVGGFNKTNKWKYVCLFFLFVFLFFGGRNQLTDDNYRNM